LPTDLRSLLGNSSDYRAVHNRRGSKGYGPLRRGDAELGGSGVLARYNELKQILSEKYGAGKPVEQIEHLYGGNDFMLEVNAGRSQWFTDYQTKDLTIQLGIGAAGTSSGFWRLIVRDRALQEEFEKGKKLNEKGAL
jgi:hypothetical protein